MALQTVYLIALCLAAVFILLSIRILYFISLMLLVTFVVCFFILMVSDGDLTLMLYDSFGDNGDNLQGRVIWITGASSGIGEELAYQLAQKGAKVVLSARRLNELNRVYQKCISFPGVSPDDVYVLPMDATQYDSHSKLAASIVERYDTIDVLINNSGRSQRALVEDCKFEVDRAILNVNLLGPISLCKAALPVMIRNGFGQIVNISSATGKMPAPLSSAYCASKHGMHGFFDTVRSELSNKNIGVTMVCPGPVVSSIVENAYREDFSRPPSKSYDGSADRNYRVLMSTERCVELTVVALANRLNEVWIARQPILLFYYMAQYAPGVTRWLTPVIGRRRVKEYRESQY
ncbi:dehydrogenase/reductase SDR family member 7-like [Diadema antillarum]|uniref:dehydrogenase/reductase SDR family member 7-like n=1 Tax=Diadema antillarum TaxID=105358 RepID=UPI003A85923D